LQGFNNVPLFFIFLVNLERSKFFLTMVLIFSKTVLPFSKTEKNLFRDPAKNSRQRSYFLKMLTHFSTLELKIDCNSFIT